MDGQRILITGGYGFIGSNLLRAVASDGTVLAVMGRDKGDTDIACGLPEHEFFFADLASEERSATEQICQFKPDVIFHLAAQPDGAESRSQARACIATNTMGTLQILEGARQTGAALIIGDSVKSYGNTDACYTSSTPEAANSSYAISKLAAWNMAKLYAGIYSLRVTCIRPTLIYGPGEGFNLIEYVMTCLTENRAEISLDGGAQTRDPLFIGDAVNAYISSAENIDRIVGRPINIGGGKEYSVHDIAETIVRLAGGNAKIVDRPADSRPTEIWRSFCDNSEALEMLGWEPAVGLEEGIERTLRFRQDQYQRQLMMA